MPMFQETLARECSQFDENETKRAPSIVILHLHEISAPSDLHRIVVDSEVLEEGDSRGVFLMPQLPSEVSEKLITLETTTYTLDFRCFLNM
jgi:hypothetical protein